VFDFRRFDLLAPNPLGCTFNRRHWAPIVANAPERTCVRVRSPSVRMRPQAVFSSRANVWAIGAETASRGGLARVRSRRGHDPLPFRSRFHGRRGADRQHRARLGLRYMVPAIPVAGAF
jgi:hypothetical protein